jgi:predicted permease
MNDLRYAFRMLLKNPGFTAIAALSLALGIGANATVFCWIDAVLLRPLSGVPKGEEMVVLTTTHGQVMMDTVSLPDLKDYRQLKDVFAGIIGSQLTPASFTIYNKPEWAYGEITTADFFDVLGIKPIAGRTFLPDEDQKPGGNPVLVLSETFWRNRFGADTNVIDRTVSVNEHAFTIVGVAPASFHGAVSGLNCDFWAPVSMHREVANFGSLEERADHWLHTEARLQPGVSIAKAQAAVDALAVQLEKAYPGTNKEIGLRVLPMWKSPYGAQAVMLPVLRILMAVTLGVLLIVAANVANLLLARATGRQKEIAIRLAVGAGRLRLIRQLLTESLLLSLVGALGGVLLANWDIELFRSFLPQSYLPIGYDFRLNERTLAFTLLLAVVTGLIFGLAPALQTTRHNLSGTLKEGGRTSGGGVAHHRLRSAFVVSEIALALLLLVSAGLCIKGFEKAKRLDVGFDPRNVLLAGLRVGMQGYNETNAIVFYRELRERLAAVPGVQEATLSSWFPLGFEGGPSIGIAPDGYVRKPNEDMGVRYSIISPQYFAALRIPLLEGRDFRDADNDKSIKVAIVNETLAKRFWPGQSPVGRKFKCWRGEVTVVAVAKAGKYRFLNERPESFLYLPYQQGTWDLNLGVALRTAANPSSMIGALRETLHTLDPRVEVWANVPMPTFIQAAFLSQAITANFLTALGVVALVLAALGIYGVMAYVVSQRTHEIGVRMALGAQAGAVLRLVIRQGMTLGLIGVGLGLVGALLLTRLISAFLYGVSPFDPLTFFGTAAVLGAVTFLASIIPACRAARVDPQVALRYE